MVLELSDKQANIKGITIKEPERAGLPFDFDQAVPPERKREIAGALASMELDFPKFEMLAYGGLIDQNLVKPYKNDDETFLSLSRGFYTNKIDHTPVGQLKFLYYSFLANVLYPKQYNRFQTYPENITDPITAFNQPMRIDNPESRLMAEIALQLVYPETFSKINFDNLEIGARIHALESFKQDSLWDIYTLYALNAKVCFPKHFEQAKIDWDWIQRGFGAKQWKTRHSPIPISFGIYPYTKFAAWTKMLMADKVSFTNNGLELAFNQISPTASVELPESRKF